MAGVEATYRAAIGADKLAEMLTTARTHLIESFAKFE